MFRCITRIRFTQQPTDAFPLRNQQIAFDFVHEFECSDSWRSLTNKASITLPKKVYYTDQNGRKQPLWGDNKNIGGFTANPFFLRGDAVTIEAGYKYFNDRQMEVEEVTQLFTGFISKVKSKIPIEIECEDNTWKLKQIAAPNKEWTKATTLEAILKELLKGTVFTVNMLTATVIRFDLGGFRTSSNETVCEVLARIRNEYHLETYFRGNELRCGSKVYLEDEAKYQNFVFQENVISDEMEYVRKEDVILSAVAHNTILDRSETTKDGEVKTKRKRLEVLVMYRFGRFATFVKQKGVEYPVQEQGERREFYFPWANTAEELAKCAQDELVKYYYTGFRGKFTTFSIPFVKQGDNAVIRDRILPERNGTYKIKSVRYTGGINGQRQEIELDYRIAVS